MKGRKRGPARALAIMMSAILIVSSMGLTAFADEQIQGSSDAGFYEETAATGTEGSAQEDESLPGDGSTEEDQDIEEQGESEETGDSSADETPGDPSSDETDDDHSADDETGDKETTDNDSQDDPASSADAESGDEGTKEDIAQSGDDEIEEDIAQSTENKAGESSEQPSGETLGAAPDESGITTWAELQEAFIAGGTVTLTQDVISSEENDDKGLYIPDGVSVTLNLGGHTLNMITSLPDPFDLEYDATEVIKVCGNLILEGEGTITGGLYGIRVDGGGSFTMNSGAVTGSDFGIRADSGSVVMNGGTVTGKTNDGIAIFSHASLTMNGGTTSGGSGNGIFISFGTFILHGGTIIGNILLQEAVITLDGKLDDAARYSVHEWNQWLPLTEEEVVITSGLSGNGSERNFVSCDEKFIAALDKDGEVVLAPKDSVAKYLERSWSGDQVVSKERARTATPFPKSKSVSGGWYYLNQNVEVDGLVSLSGDTWLILGDGNTLDVEGLYIPQGSTLTIYAQSDGENAGKIYSHPSGGAAIGATSNNHLGGEIVIHGGNIEANGADHCAGIGSNDGNGTTAPITIYGGSITATGGSDGAGIGGGRNCEGGEITIYGGEITAKGSSKGAGIGGGNKGSGGTIKIYGGTITTSDSPNENGAGIGGGDSADGGNITIEGGTITVYSRDGAGIGGGDDGNGGNITINGGDVYSYSVNEGWGARIGGGAKSSSSATAGGGIVVINGGNITATGGKGAGIGGGYRCTGGTVNINGGVINASGSYGIGSGEDGSDVAVTLGYTDATKETISITASTFNGTVTLEKPFGRYTGNAGQNLTTTFMPGEVSDNSLLAEGTLKACDVEINSWNALQMAINGASDGMMIKLTQDISATYAQDNALVVGSNKNITIDLNGCALNRGLTTYEAAANGYVIQNEGTLTITDSSSAKTGTITGGNCKYAGGGIYNSGTLTITGGAITGNAASTLGGGVYLPDVSANNNVTATLNLNGGSITNNICGNNGGGVHVSGTASMTVSGSPVVSDNTKSGVANNINLAENAVIKVTGPLTEGANLGVSGSTGTAVITSGYSANNGTTDPDAFFRADNESYGVILDTGEVKIDAILSDISYLKRSWNGTAVTTTKTVTSGKVRAVPADGGMTDGWYYLNSDITVDGRISLTGNTDLILGDGHTLNVKGIYIPQGSTLTVYAQSDGKRVGKIISKPDEGAGIGATSNNHPGGSIAIHGGVIEATGAEHCAGIGSNDGNGTTAPITIYSGTITAKGGSDGAGIGGGRNCDGGNITIYGGDINAKGGGENGAGIGGGDNADGGTIKIYGGTITANEDSNEDGAGIGGGDAGDGGSITIYGGTITTYSRDGAGIGGGDDGDGGTITINGGTITCRDEGHAQGARIGGGSDGDGGIITISGGTIDVYFRDGAGIGGGEDGDGGIIKIGGGIITTHPEGQGNAAGIGGGNHSGAGGTITITGGEVHANATRAAGIGGGRASEPKPFGSHGNSGNGGTITITGGEVHATSEYAFGIGAGGPDFRSPVENDHEYISSYSGSAGTITIKGDAVVTANGHMAGIGGDSGTIKIQGGIVTAGGFTNGIGSGIYLISDEGLVHISGGTVNATAKGRYAAIFTGNSTVRISGGTVTAESEYGAAIGMNNTSDHTGNEGPDTTLIIEGNNTNVSATSSYYVGIGAEKCAKGKGKWIFRSGARIEVTSGMEGTSRNAKILYEGARITAGNTREDAILIPAEDRESANGYKYRLIEPCDHLDPSTHGSMVDETGKCRACGWKSGSYLVIYELDESDVTTVELVENGGKAPKPEDPTREGAVFVDWHQVLEGGTLAAEPYNFDAVVTEDIRLRAVWIHEHDGITFEYWNADDGLPAKAGSYCLTQDVMLTDSWTWSDGTLNLCLNGHTIQAYQFNDPVITINGGTLNLYDEEGGTVTQAAGQEDTVFVAPNGNLNMYGGTIAGATNADSGPKSGVEVSGSFNMSGGSVTGNPKGVWVNGGTFTVSGSAQVTGNAENVLLPENGIIRIGGTLEEDAMIGVSAQPGVFTDGLSGKGDESNFFSDDNHYVVVLQEEGENAGEAALEGAHRVTFEPGDENAIGDMPRRKVGRTLTLPDCEYSVEGKTFKEWSVKVGDAEPVTGKPGDEITVTADTTVTAMWTEIEEVTINGVTGSFNDKIKLNYYFFFPKKVHDDENAYVTLTNAEAEKEVTIPVKDAELTKDGYKFSIELAAKEASDIITARAYDGQGNALTIIGNRYGNNYTDTGVQSSLMEYFTWLEKNGKDDKEKAIGTAAKDYCAAAQLYFGYHVTEGLAVSSAVDAVTADTLSSYIAGREGTLPKGVSIKGISAMLESDNTLRLYYGFDGVESSALSFAIDGNEADLIPRSDGMCYLALDDGVYSNRLQDTHTYSVSDGTDTYTITASVLTYARTCANKKNEKESNLGKTLYLYNQAAVEAFGN